MSNLPGLTAELELLTQALDLPGTDLADTLARLAADMQSAVDSYLGLSVIIVADGAEFDLTVLAEGKPPADIRTSLLIPLVTPIPGIDRTPTPVSLVLFAGNPGAFIDLAADLSWVTGRSPAEFRLDEHLTSRRSPVGAMSSINQALGVLIGRGSSPEEAERDLYAGAVRAGTDLLGAATLILGVLGEGPETA